MLFRSNKTTIKSNFQNQQIDNLPSTNSGEDFDNSLANVDERRLPWPGGIKQVSAKLDIQENKFNEEIFKNKPIAFYRFLIEKIAELKFSFGEFLNSKEILSRSPYLIYLYAFMILFTFGIGIGFLRNNFKKSIQNEVVSDKPLIAVEKIQNISKKDITQEIKKKPSNELNSTIANSAVNNSFKVEKITKASPSIAEIKNLINAWLFSKSNYLAGKSEINLSKIGRAHV